MAESALIRLLSEHDRELINELREKHPGAKEIFDPTRKRKLGGVAQGAEAVAQSVTEARLDLVIKGIKPLREKLEEIIAVVLRKMKQVKTVKTLGAVAAALSGVSIAGLEASGTSADWVKFVSAAFATVGGLVVILSDHFAQAPNGVNIASAEEYGKLEQMFRELVKAEQRVERHAVIPLREDVIEEMIASLEDYAAHINSLTLNANA